MMSERRGVQLSLYTPSLDEIVEGDECLRKVDAAVDFSFIYDELRPYYCADNGRYSTDPVVIVKSLLNNKSSLCCVLNILCDGGYTGKPFADAVNAAIGANVEIVKKNELHQFIVLPKRWVVERTFGWLDKCRRLWKNYELKLHTSLQMTVLAFISLLLKRF